jgi:hypothetical protein
MTKTFEALGHSYAFDTHGTHNSYNSKLAVNIKYYKYPKLSAIYQDKVDQLKAAGVDVDKLEWDAREETQQLWWQWAADESVARGLGPSYSAGRQGGWLILDEWTPSRVEEWMDEREERCQHCDGYEDVHADDKCLYQPTEWAPVPRLPHATVERMDQIEKFFKDVRENVDQLDARVLADWEEHIDRKLAELEETAEESSDEPPETVGRLLHGHRESGVSESDVRP